MFPSSLKAARDKNPESCLVATGNSGSLRIEVTCLLERVCCNKLPCMQLQKVGWLNDTTGCAYSLEKMDTFLGVGRARQVKNLRDPGRRLIPGEGEWVRLNFAECICICVRCLVIAQTHQKWSQGRMNEEISGKASIEIL